MKYILGIETSCDETAAAVLGEDLHVLANVVLSQIDIHKEFGGVVPEIASRNHVKGIDKVVQAAIREAGIELKDVSVVATTVEPGLPGAVMVGRVFGEALAVALGVPFIRVHHILGHIASIALTGERFKEHIALVVSGGHTSLYDVDANGIVTEIERTVDDAIGEAFDKVARVMGLEYPGGPVISKLADEYMGELINFVARPNYKIKGFSYSGLKTAVLNYINREQMAGRQIDKRKIAASFQVEAVEQIIYKCLRLLKDSKIKVLTVSGGVSANKHLRNRLAEECRNIGVKVYFPEMKYTGDNAAMIAASAIIGLKFKVT
ncbi:MAG: tRNA (adenosine(37)-N6)-threonylcarbamoyltransferase complex transferase subunit TsaD [Firmicutes bacterium]|nr:tRNA (adenosine(37)-N6)-threonylcarbamoyltransferase complex transferase subunit TsaD [Bacillota bacterium]